MLVYAAISPAPRCVRMSLQKKRLQLPATTVDVFAGENCQPAYLAVNPASQTPALQCFARVTAHPSAGQSRQLPADAA